MFKEYLIESIANKMKSALAFAEKSGFDGKFTPIGMILVKDNETYGLIEPEDDYKKIIANAKKKKPSKSMNNILADYAKSGKNPRDIGKN